MPSESIFRLFWYAVGYKWMRDNGAANIGAIVGSFLANNLFSIPFIILGFFFVAFNPAIFSEALLERALPVSDEKAMKIREHASKLLDGWESDGSQFLPKKDEALMAMKNVWLRFTGGKRDELDVDVLRQVWRTQTNEATNREYIMNFLAEMG